MAIKLGSSDISKVYLGATEVSKIYLGATEVYSSGFGTYVDAMITRANALSYTLPSNATLTDLQTRLANIGDTILNKLDCLQIYSADTGTEDFCTLNVVDPTVFQATLVNAPALDKDGVISVSSTASYINSNFIPSSGSNYTLNDNHFQTDIRNDITGGLLYFAGNDETATNSVSVIALLQSIARDYNGNNQSGVTNAQSIASGYFLNGLHSNVRIASTNFKSYNNSVEYSNQTRTTTALSDIPMYVGTYNINGGVPSSSARPNNQFGFFSAGASLSTAEMTTIKTQMGLYYGR